MKRTRALPPGHHDPNGFIPVLLCPPAHPLPHRQLCILFRKVLFLAYTEKHYKSWSCPRPPLLFGGGRFHL